MASKNRFLTLFQLCVASLLAARCAPAIQTQPDRLLFLDATVKENLHKTMACNDVKLSFQKTDQTGTAWYDIYTAEGCGRRSEFVTMVEQQTIGTATFTRWLVSLAGPAGEFQAAAYAQLERTAGFDLGCKSLEFTPLHELLARLRNSYDGTIGVAGCGKKATYRVTRALQGYDGESRDIVCKSTANPAPGGQ